ncbi:hypothetical protein Tcan_01333, partial [Toxocara canis]
KRRCPEATVFDNTQHICVWSEQCKQLAAVSTTVLSYTYESSTSTPFVIPVADANIDCGSLADGHYSTGCTMEYVSCVDGVKKARSCPAGLVFDNIARECVWPDDCAASIPSTYPAAQQQRIRGSTVIPS